VCIYMVHVSPDKGRSDPDPVLLKDGFSFFAFVFTGLWALWHRMWLVAALIFCGGGLLEVVLALSGSTDELRLIVRLAFCTIVGFGANDWLSAFLEKQGYDLAGVVSAPRPDAALRRWFDLQGFAGT
jgi:hypothetical protein